MLGALKRILGIRVTDHNGVPLFSGSAYFSKRVPRAVSEKWVAHGGEISTGTTLNVRARYFFATDPSEPWVTKLFAKSVMVIHAGWIVHCVDEAFKVPIAEYILDDRFVPEPPYKLTGHFTPLIYIPLSDPVGPDDTESGESGPTPLQTSDTPSTPTSIPRKRKREQAYFDSPSGSLVFSGFDKDGMPQRPKKQRKLRFGPSFSPERGKLGGHAVSHLDWLRDAHDTARNDVELSKAHGQGGAAGALRGVTTTVRSPDTPDKPFAIHERTSVTYRYLAVDEKDLVSSPTISIDQQRKMKSVRSIDFTNLPPSIRRRRFVVAKGAKSGDTSTALSIVRPTESKIKLPKKISFADHARVCVYMVSPCRPDVKDDVGLGSVRRSLSEGFEDTLETKTDGKIWVSSDDEQSPDESIAEATQNVATRTKSDPKYHNDGFARLPGVDQSGNDTLTLTMEEVQAMRSRLLKSVEKDGVDNGQLSTLFELGKTYRGITFRHVW